MKIRTITDKDFNSIYELMDQVHSLHAQNRPDLFNETAPLTQDSFDKLLNSPDTYTLVADSEGQVAGFCVLIIKLPLHNPIARPRTVAYIDDLFVLPEYRRQGIGGKLLEEAQAIGRKNQADSLELKVWAFNEKAIQFYHNIGMTERSFIMEKKL